MARIQSPPILSQIRVARSYSDQTAALRALKDDIVGHIQRKERWIESGILESLVKNLQAVRSPASRNGDETHSNEGQPRPLAESERVRLLSLELIASFASGGPSFLAPLRAVNAIPAILSHISPSENPPQIVLTALRALRDIASASALASPGPYDDATTLSDLLFKPQHLNSMNLILGSNSSIMAVQEQKCIVANLINRLCRTPQHQNVLASQGILDSLASQLASFAVSRGEVVPGAELLARADGLDTMIPDPAPLGLDLAAVLEAISTIIADSPYRACMLMYSPAILAIFPNAEFTPATKEAKAARNALEVSGLSTARSRNPGAIEYLLPVVPITHPRSLSQFTQFPPLGFSPSSDNLVSAARPITTKFSGWDPTRFESGSSNGDAELEDAESPLIPWLIHLVRTTDGLERVMAASVLATLYKAGFALPEREVAIGLLVVPLLCGLIRDHDKSLPPTVQNSSFIDRDVALDWVILERTPAVLARLLTDSDYLQQAAHDCGAMRMVHKLLKDAYAEMPVQTASRPWSPIPEHSVVHEDGLPTCRNGPPGQLPIYAHKIKMRESSLKLVVGLVANKEDYRKAIADHDVLPYIVESLTSTPSKPRNAKEKSKAEKAAEDDMEIHRELSPYGSNPNSVIVAACHVIRVLSRSPSNLRTVLEDHGVAMPIFRLLKHSVADIQIAACGAVCNLVLNHSPMREPLLQAGILRVLCEQARSDNPGLRLNAMWALKHLVDGADNQLKKDALDELESGYLTRLICDDIEDKALHTRVQLDQQLEHDSRDADNDEDMDEGNYEDLSGTATYLGNQTTSKPSSQRLQRAERKISMLREAELNLTRKARNDDLAIQEQGLNFIRNLICLPSPPGDMIEHIFREIGQEQLFRILSKKLQVKVLHPFGRKHASAPDSRVLYPQAKVIEAVVYVLANIAASLPKHRQLVMAQTELLKLLHGHINSRDTEVRRALCHLLSNLGEREEDIMGGEQRASELKKLGFLAKLEELQEKDSDLDVRETAKAAVWRIKAPAP
ncbi:armadillo repeat protein [Cercophora newfieldiana]|uniref:Armadillo repeat protein n=1 Tax=Cercophora newfieldiana TaxID=92897 RepID=A0AA39XS89_9PEZI|nr:armadillo repeat protein [Cercophora newfieldiana]